MFGVLDRIKLAWRNATAKNCPRDRSRARSDFEDRQTGSNVYDGLSIQPLKKRMSSSNFSVSLRLISGIMTLLRTA
jgi:hypothetical protein